jgi:hypothetical protein
MNEHEQSYDKYLIENDQFFYDEQNNKKGAFLKQESELFNEEEAAIPGASVRARLVDGDWSVLVNGEEFLVLKGSRFTAAERKFLCTKEGVQFIVAGVKQGWNSVSEFKRQLKDKV